MIVDGKDALAAEKKVKNGGGRWVMANWRIVGRACPLDWDFPYGSPGKMTKASIDNRLFDRVG